MNCATENPRMALFFTLGQTPFSWVSPFAYLTKRLMAAI